jgi:hypothetical protein
LPSILIVSQQEYHGLEHPIRFTEYRHGKNPDVTGIDAFHWRGSIYLASPTTNRKGDPFMDCIQAMIAGYATSPKGQEAIRKFLSSPEGQKTIDRYLATPEGKKMASLLLKKALDGLDLPAPVKDQIRTALADKTD